MSRNPTFDIMKGITILLVILGHESWLPELVKKIIFAFHMPLFFMISGYFYKAHDIKRDIRRLVVPYLFTGGLLAAYHIISNLPSFDVLVLKRDILNIFWGSGSLHSAYIWGQKPCIGAIWFLLALFWCRLVYGVVKAKIKTKIGVFIAVVSISVVAILMDRYVISLPLAVLPGCSAAIFMYIGDCFKAGARKTVMLLSVVFFVVSVLSQQIVCLVNCHYRIYPLTVLGAVGGTYLVYMLSTLIERMGNVRTFFEWAGRVSLPILCFHLFQLNTNFLKPDIATIAIINAFAFPLIAAALCSKVKVTKRIFGIKGKV